MRDLTQTPIIVISGLTHEDTVVAAFEAGADDYVRKPCATAVLMARIEHKLRYSQAQPQPPKTQIEARWPSTCRSAR
ncbi:MAG: response regulator [Caldilineaceae bacterium]